jgi:Na+-translocating ferredoxin:NAD+ oxidoreductase RnfD subunit
MMLPVLSELSELYRAADGAATACLLAKLGVEKSLMAKLEDTRQALLVGEQPAILATAATEVQPLLAGVCCCCQHHVTHDTPAAQLYKFRMRLGRVVTCWQPSSSVQCGGA